jgi:uncharacterized membrane protein
MNMLELKMMVEECENGYYIGQIVEYPAVLSQGKTIVFRKVISGCRLDLYSMRV